MGAAAVVGAGGRGTRSRTHGLAVLAALSRRTDDLAVLDFPGTRVRNSEGCAMSCVRVSLSRARARSRRRFVRGDATIRDGNFEAAY